MPYNSSTSVRGIFESPFSGNGRMRSGLAMN